MNKCKINGWTKKETIKWIETSYKILNMFAFYINPICYGTVIVLYITTFSIIWD